MIYTSYFAKLRSLPDNIVPVSICGKAPDWYNGLEYKKLAPKYDFFMKWKETKDNNYYIKCYTEQVLDKLTIETVLEDLFNLVYMDRNNLGKHICLICYERPGEFCHRNLVSNWLNKDRITCGEYQF